LQKTDAGKRISQRTTDNGQLTPGAAGQEKTMGQVQRGVVKGSNKEGLGGDGRTNGFMPLSGGASTVQPSNMGMGGDKRSGSFPLSGGTPMVKPPEHRFNVSDVQMPQPASAIEPGKGAIPVNPFLPSGAVARVAGYTADDAKGR
jgi:hypothetical protein